MDKIYYHGSDGSIHILGDEYLSHHGVLGMKWGVRNDPRRSLNRLYRMDQQANKAFVDNGRLLSKSARKTKKANKLRVKANKTGNEKYNRKADRLDRKANKLQEEAGKTMYKGRVRDRMPTLHPSYSKLNRKATKYAAKISEQYSDVDVSTLNQNQVYVGRKYAVKFVG